MIVVDASALAEYIVDTPTGRQVGDQLLVDRDVHMPHLASVEATSVIRGWVRGGKLQEVLATQALADLAQLPVERHEHEALLPRVWQLRHNLSAYDAVYVALAEALDADLLTCDARLARSGAGEARMRLLDRAE